MATPSLAKAQDKALVLPQVSVSADRLVAKADSASLLQTDSGAAGGSGLIQLLEKKSSLYLRNYGPAGFSGISIRGTASPHTQVVWRDLPLNNSMLGMSDLSLICGPVMHMARLQEGGSCRASVSENFGGIIFLGAPLPRNNSLLVGNQTGSFGTFNSWVSAGFARNNFSGRINIWNHESKNNFPYRQDGEWKTTSHARRHSSGLESLLGFRISDHWKWTGSIWLQKTGRQIPAAMYQNYSEAVQSDQSLRTSQSLEFEKGNTSLKAGYGLISESLHYADPEAGINSQSVVIQNFAWINWEQKLRKARVQNQLWYNHAGARTAQYAGQATLFRLAILQAIEMELGPHFLLKIQNRSERFQYAQSGRHGLAFQPSASLHFQNRALGKFSGGYFRKMRLPGLNDLFWIPGGNPGLKPEQGWNLELNWEKPLIRQNGLFWTLEGKSYMSEIEDFILWMPRGLIWSADNLGRVQIRGLEVSHSLKWTSGQLGFLLENHGHFCSSQNQTARFSGDASVGKQMPYVPVFQYRTRLEASLKNTRLILEQQGTGSRAADPSGAQTLPAFYLIHVRAETRQKVRGSLQFYLFAECLNLGDAQYRMVMGFPMPGRQYNFGIQLEIKSLQK